MIRTTGFGWSLIFLCHVSVSFLAEASITYPGAQPGSACQTLSDGRMTLSNKVVSASWTLTRTGFHWNGVRDQVTDSTIDVSGDVFQVVLSDGTQYCSSALKPISKAASTTIQGAANASRAAARCRAFAFEVRFTTSDERLDIKWQAILRDGANYVRQELEISSPQKDVLVKEIVWLHEPINGAKTIGSVDGSLVHANTFFLGCEDPMALNGARTPSGQNESITRCVLPWNTQLKQGEVLKTSLVTGVVPEGQLRRGFLCYLEQQRAHPYRPYLHYNSWYDIAWKPFEMDEPKCLNAIQVTCDNLVRRHGAVLDGLVFDDGWDNPKTLWQFHDRFPTGFTPLANKCREYHTHLGVWLSPFGGYGEPKRQRLEFGRQQGFEINETGFSLAGPKYYRVFKEACTRMIRDYGVNHFKFDGIAKGMSAAGGGEYMRDTAAMRRLMLELRNEDPNLFVNLTTGSWPSPFWLRYADSIWRQGHDMGFAGPGPKQQQWLTYRDQEVFRNIVCRAPLYPLSSLMTQGVAYSRQGSAGDSTFNSTGFTDDVRAFFGAGTCLQELYIQPERLTNDDWAVLAEAAKWSRANADVLADTHWIGGDPGKLEVYGYASWAPRKGTIMLRNPNDKTQTVTIDATTAFELPDAAPRKYELTSPWLIPVMQTRSLEAGQPTTFELDPFEVLVFDAIPLRE